MQRMLHLLLAATLTIVGCSSSDGGSGPVPGTAACSAEGQKQFVLDQMRDVYLWNDLLPATVDLTTFATAEELLAHLVSFQPLDDFSFINPADADAAFFGEGQFQGYGFSIRFEAADDLRFTRVFADSPAAVAGLARGQRIIMLNGRTIADVEANEGVGALFALPSLEFTIRRLDLTEFTITINQDIVTIDPLPQWRVIDTPSGSSVAYFEMAQFISTADPVFATMFSEFNQAGVTDLIVDLRYNGGGLVSTTELLGDYLGGGVANNQVFSRTLFNANNAASNRTEFFEGRGNSLNLSRLVVVGGPGTASASELVTNSMEPWVETSIVGAKTFGKPVGQLGLLFCDKVLRPTAFETVNALDEGGYFDGLPADCAAADDVSIPVGDDTDPNIVAALTLLETGACPPAPLGQAKPEYRRVVRGADRHGPPAREFADAW